MQKLFLLLIIAFSFSACKLSNSNQHQTPNAELGFLLDKYYEEYIQLFPLNATTNGDNRYNDKLYADFTDTYRNQLRAFYNKYKAYVSKFDYNELTANDKISVDVLNNEIDIALKGLEQIDNLMPLNQFYGMHLTIAQFGSGEGVQPFKTKTDYYNWISRATAFNSYIDSAITYFKKGMADSIVLPESLVKKIIPQCADMMVMDVTKSLFWGPVQKMPTSFSASLKDSITKDYTLLINNQLIPAYTKLHQFLQSTYLPLARKTSGLSNLKNGNKYYDYLVKYWTTTNKTPEEIYQTGLNEVARIKTEMENVKEQVGFKGDLKAFFDFMKKDKQFTPFKTDEEVITAFKNIQTRIDTNLKKMFINTPKTKFEIRQTEAFREASASAEYVQGSADGSRPGIFYVPIIEAKTFNSTSGMESLFLHEAIPGHHYQVSLQQENTSLPKFRRFLWYGAYGEGWALYTESLGKELGLYTDPYQYMGALGDEMHRAIRLVVDVAIHTKNMTREQAIAYMMENEQISEQGATAEIERYMAIPAQALSYKTGSLQIKAWREKYTKQLGDKFSLAKFHDTFLSTGCLPLLVAEKNLDAWAEKL
jgi:uncharacterized protein (DUF885 family)